MAGEPVSGAHLRACSASQLVPGRVFDQPVDLVRPEQDPVPGSKVEALAAHFEHSPTDQDHDATEAGDLHTVLTSGRRVGRREKSAADDVRQNNRSLGSGCIEPPQPLSGNGIQFCTTTQQTPAAGAGGLPRLHWLVGG